MSLDRGLDCSSALVTVEEAVVGGSLVTRLEDEEPGLGAWLTASDPPSDWGCTGLVSDWDASEVLCSSPVVEYGAVLGASDRAGVDSDKDFSVSAVEVDAGWRLESEEGALPEELKPVITAEDEGSKLFPGSDNVELRVDWTVVASLTCVSLGIPLVPCATGELELGTTVKVVEPCGDPVGFELGRRDDDTGAFEPKAMSEGVEVSERTVDVEAEEVS